ncbi:single-stranded DNA-binding protein [Ruegeria atlantica]|uniref:single-stranded DNA-binding protein n=1 Tax=Ruegeria atlantica TaxID=81569 RepID=UPI001481B455|nr:single-stranded DNA-binding protein [Ruegeria atlantica]
MYYENKVHLVGCLGRDPEVRTFGNGGKVANLRLATTRSWKDQGTGEWREKTEWHSVAVSNPNLVRRVEEKTRKGSYLRIVGRLETRKWQDQSGQDRYSTEVVVAGYDGELGVLDRPGGQEGGSGYHGDQGGGYSPQGGVGDDHIPY